MTTFLDGLSVSRLIRADLKKQTETLKKSGARAPSLAVVIVGEDPASQTYVNSKAKQCAEVGFYSKIVAFPENITTETLLNEIKHLNVDSTVDGILVQLPLPSHVNERKIIEAIEPHKDVDGLHPLNVGLLEVGTPSFIPCTPKGIIRILDEYGLELSGKAVLVIGRSRLVGKPVATLLTQRNATVTLAHSKSINLEKLVGQADILVVAMGSPEAIPSAWLNEKQVVVDVGIHRIEGKLVGDVDRSAYDKVAYITPVPKGIGPMTIASLLENTMKAYHGKEHHNES